MKTPVMHLLPSAEAARDQECVNVGFIAKCVIRNDGKTRLGLNGPHRVCNHKCVEFGVEPASDRKDAVRGGEVDDLGILENVNAKSKTVNARIGLLRLHRRRLQTCDMEGALCLSISGRKFGEAMPGIHSFSQCRGAIPFTRSGRPCPAVRFYDSGREFSRRS